MSKVKTLFANAKKPLAAVAVAAAGMSSQVMAADYTAAIGTATTEGQANVTAVIAGCIAVAVLGFGVGSMLGWFKRG